MFTGLIEARGVLSALHPHDRSADVTLEDVPFAAALSRGDSVAVNGVCLTVLEHGDSSFTADVMAETLQRTTLGTLASGVAVNLERALQADARLGGHIVQGHVDAVAEVLSTSTVGEQLVLRLSLIPDVADLVVFKGSIAVDGVSLTVSARGDAWFEVSLIPQTQHDTDLGSLNPGDRVNIETDVLARHVQRLLQSQGVLRAPAHDTEEVVR
ncbi:riboflavin synthase [Pseudoclavibacter sp. 13-3]|uniref:riboflavin synthase n=1 Tax=Pseudoclavibacter sp. 13-3 TaxID=2901228 RepID=UPI001E582B02|nr:riboflavin synthase [Pseudoclavibacter sp. 13-3]MCD7102187.1 riboflavin synthase [Pseudoclavibacter sp. 13-3]